MVNRIHGQPNRTEHHGQTGSAAWSRSWSMVWSKVTVKWGALPDRERAANKQAAAGGRDILARAL